MININIPDIQNSNIQPDYTKYASFPGFVFYHSLKEWYFIYNDLSTKVKPDYLLDILDLPGSYSMLVGSNNNNIYIAQPETAKLLKLQVNPNTGEEISKEVFDVNQYFIDLEIGEGAAITGGIINGNNILLLITIAVQNGGSLVATPFVLYSNNNGSTYTTINFDGTVVDIFPTGIEYINFYNTYYYLVLATSKINNQIHLFVISEEDLELGGDPFRFLQTFSGGTFTDATRKHINRQLHWNHNVLYTLSDDRSSRLAFKTALHSISNNYNSIYPIPSFEVAIEPAPPSTVITQIEKVNNNNILTPSLETHLKQETVSNGVIPSSITTSFSNYLIWDTVKEGITDTVVDFLPYSDKEILTLTRLASGIVSIKNNKLDGTTSTINLTEVPLDRFNTGGIHWSGEIVDSSQQPSWHPNTNKASWISHDEDTFIIDYGNSPFDYVLQLDIDLPIASSISGTLYFDSDIQDILVDGVSTNQSFSNTDPSTPTLFSLTLPKGPSLVTFQMRNAVDSTPNPTGLKIQWDPISIPSFPLGHSDMFIDLEEDRLYIAMEPYAWVVKLSTMNILAVVNLLAEELPGGPFLIPSGVAASTSTPIKWKWVKEFDDVYIYNEYHDNTYSTSSNHSFYNWRINPEDPSYHTMYSAFELDPLVCTHLHYFFAINNELHAILVSRNANNPTSSFKSTQYRLSGLANFAQVTSEEVVAGNFVTSNVYVANDGKVYLSQSLGPSNYQAANSSLYVYVNKNGENIDKGSYVIATDASSNPYNFNAFKKWNSQPTSYTSVAPTNFDKMAKYTQIPGDYTASTIVNSTNIRKENNSSLPVLLGNSINLSKNLVFNIAEEDIINSKISTSQHWTYFLLYNNVSFTYRLIRARAVFYPTS